MIKIRETKDNKLAIAIIRWIVKNHTHDHNIENRDYDDESRPCVDSLNLEAYIRKLAKLPKISVDILTAIDEAKKRKSKR